VHDLIDSTYTTAGKLDGSIYYVNFIEYMSSHPIIEMLLSPQFQGPVKSKLQELERALSEEEARKKMAELRDV